MDRMKKAVNEKKEAVRSKVQEMVDYHSSQKSFRHVKSSERAHGKRYKNTQSVFSINDDSDLSDDEGFNGNLVASTSAVEKVGEHRNKEVKLLFQLKWSDICRRSDVFKHFEGHEVFQDKSYLKCYLLITSTDLYIYHAISNDDPGCIRLHVQHPLPTILRVTSKRRVPEFLTFKFGHELPSGESKITRVHCFLLEKSGYVVLYGRTLNLILVIAQLPSSKRCITWES